MGNNGAIQEKDKHTELRTHTIKVANIIHSKARYDHTTGLIILEIQIAKYDTAFIIEFGFTTT